LGLSDIVLQMHTTRDQLVKFIIERLTDLAFTPRSVSLSLGKSPTYLADFLGKKASPNVLDEDTRANLARILSTSEENLRFQRSFVKTSVGLRDIDVSHTGNGLPVVRRTVEMRVDSIFEELGRIKERLDRLEGQSVRDHQTGAGKKPRPQ
jgi:AraC-like DNA-binding protein